MKVTVCALTVAITAVLAIVEGASIKKNLRGEPNDVDGKLQDQKKLIGVKDGVFADPDEHHNKDPSDPPFEGGKPDIRPPPRDDPRPLEIALGKASGDYNGDVYSDKTNNPAEHVPEDVAERWDGNKPGPPEHSNSGGNEGKQAQFEIKNKKIRCFAKYKPGMKDKLMRGLVDSETHYEFDDLDTVVVSIPTNALNGLKNNPNIVEIYPDNEVKLVAPVNEEHNGTNIVPVDEESDISVTNRRGRHLQETPYGVKMLDIKLLKKKGEGVKVCVLDTGYTRSHEDLPYSVDWVGNGIDPNNPPIDYDGHGTHVAGTIAALGNDKGVVGVAPGVSLIIGPYLNQAQGTVYISNAVDGIRKCRDKGAKIVNMSFGRFGDFNAGENDVLNGFYNNNDMLLVAAAGNHGRGDEGVPSNAEHFPAAYDAVVSVGAVNSDGVRAPFSAKRNDVDITAPGVMVQSTSRTGGYAMMSGTSMASPHVVGVAARVWSIMPWLTAAQLRSFLSNAAQYEYQSFTGQGLVNTGFYTIMLQKSGKCLDNYNSKIGLYTCGIGYTDQQFTYDSFNNMIVGSDGKCLHSGGNSNGAAVTYTTCSKTDSNQKWTYSSSSKEFKNNGGYCLDNHGSYEFQNNGLVQIYYCHGRSNQKWLLGKDYETLLNQDDDMYTGGKMYRTPGAGRWYTMPEEIKHDRLSRVHIPIGFAIEYFEHPSYGGWNRIYGSNEYGINLRMGGHNDAVSSFKVRKLPEGIVKLCKHYDCSSYYHNSRVKEYASMPDVIGNDQLSRVLIPRGYYFQYFEHTNFGGWSGAFGNCNNEVNLSMGGHNDAVGSYKIKVLDC